MVGSWKGGSFDTGHSTHKILDDFKWAGKDFRSADDVDPIMLFKEDGSRVWLDTYGHARVSFLLLFQRPGLYGRQGQYSQIVLTTSVWAASQG